MYGNYFQSLGEFKPSSFIFVSLLVYLWCKKALDKPAEHEDISPGKEKMFQEWKIADIIAFTANILRNLHCLYSRDHKSSGYVDLLKDIT